MTQVVQSFRERRQLRAARRVADRELLRSPVPSLRFSWRAAELVIPKRRLDLAHLLRRLVHDADARLLPGAQTFDRLEVRAEAESFLALADRLADLERPVAPRGILLLEQLLDDTRSPLHDRGRTDELRECLDEAEEALEH